MLCALMVCPGSVVLAAGKQGAPAYYRYENDQGRKVMTQTMPPQFVHKGYEILNAKGRVIGVVPRALTDEELKALSAEEEAKLSRQEQMVRDKKLLSIFSSPEDAVRARDRKLEAIDVYINVTRGNINKLQADYNDAQSRAAERERAGQEVQDFLVEKMDSLGRQIEQAEESIKEKQAEKVGIRKEYQKDIDRLEYLVELRAKAAAEQGHP